MACAHHTIHIYFLILHTPMAQTQNTSTIPNLARNLEMSQTNSLHIKTPTCNAQKQTITTIPNQDPNLEKSQNNTFETNSPTCIAKKQTNLEIPNLDPDLEKSLNDQPDQDVDFFDYSKRAQWLRAAVLGANDGLLSTAALMVGVGAVRKDSGTMIITGVAGMVAGACSMAIGEFVSVHSQYDIEMSQMKRESEGSIVSEQKKKGLPSPLKAAGASALAFAVGAMVPLLAAAFVGSYKMRLGIVVAAVSLSLIGFGLLGAYLGRAPLVRSSLRVLFGGWLAMGITFGLTRLVGSFGI